MTPRLAALVRLYGVQAAWTYERMAGIGVGHASAPLLRDLFAASEPRERRAAVARSAEFFNCHPYLAGIAVGAVVRAERDGVDPAQISRLRTALSGPLGSIGDQLIWAGQVPALMGLALAASPWAGAWVVVALLLAHNVARFLLTSWGLDLGLREGLAVGGALNRSWIARRASDAQRLAAFAVGLATPIVAWQLLGAARPRAWAIVGAITVVGSVLALAPGTRSHVSGLRVGLGLLAVAGLVIGGLS